MSSLYALRSYLFAYKWRFFWGIVFIFASTYVGVRVPVVVGDTVNAVTVRASLMDDLLWAGIYIVALAGLAGAFRYLMRRVLIDTSRDIEFDFRNDLYARLQDLDATFYDKHSTGDIMSRMTNDIDAVRMMMGPAIMYSAGAVFSIPLIMGQMLLLDWRVTLAGLVPILFMPVLVRFVGQEFHRRFRAQQDKLGELTTYVQETLAGVRVVKAYGREEIYTGNFDVENDEFIEKSMSAVRLQAFIWPLVRTFGGIGVLVTLLLGAHRVIGGHLEIGTLLSLLILFSMLVWPLTAIGWVINLFHRANASMDRIKDILEAESAVVDGPSVVPVESLPRKLDVEFRNLTFTYPGADHPALSDITLRIAPGKTIGIVGRVGSGKSTLVHMLMRMYPVERGQLFIGGIDINDWPLEELRRRVGIVFQETFLFSETIGENIQFGAHGPLTDEEIREAARKADVHKDIVDFPEGYETVLGERGINLSGGQKQRLSTARVLVRDASILVLDDCLSAVDTHTEAAILRSLHTEVRDRTTFMISHRISTVAMADEVIVLEDGRLTQRGTHEQLAAAPGLYSELHRRQLLEEEVEAIG